MDVYDRLGLEPVINAWGTMTRLGGSLMDARTLQAMAEASRCFIDLDALLAAASARIAALLGAEAACITSGATAGIAVATAACMAGADPARVAQLPVADGLRDRVVILHSHRFVYDGAALLAGARYREVGGADGTVAADVDAALDDDVAMILYAAQAEPLPASLPLADVCAVAARHGVAVAVDAAAELPPRANIGRYFRDGADLVILSGGKQIRGPQSSGIILGGRELIAACVANCAPNVSIGRPMKVDKETAVGLMTAVEIFVDTDEDTLRREWSDIVDAMVVALSALPGITVRRGLPVAPDIQPMGIPRAYVGGLPRPVLRLRQELLRGSPPVAVAVSGDELMLNPQCLSPHQVPTLVATLARALGVEVEQERTT